MLFKLILIGKLEHEKIMDEFESSEYWFYPTNFNESYCMSAVEAQMSKCVCIATNIGALSEIVGDRGILINEVIGSNEYKKKAITEILNLVNNQELKEKYQEMGYEWAKNQTWNNRVKQWYKLFEKNNNII